MNKGLKLAILVGIAVGLIKPLYAANSSNEDVLSWTEKTLLKTFTVDYNNLTEQSKQSKKNYTAEAWQALDSFLGSKVPTIQNNQLSLHPKPLGKGQITNSGILFDTNYWNIHQLFLIPELHTTLNCSVIIVKKENASYLIQSVNILLQKDTN